MITQSSSVLSAILADASRRVFGGSRKRSKAAALCVVLAVLLCGAARNASAQTAHFSWVQTTIGGGFEMPAGVAVDNSGNVYVADYMNNAIKEIVAVNGSIPASPTIRTLGSGFSHPMAVAVDGNGDVFVSDFGNQAFKEIVAVSNSIPASPTIVTLGTSSSPGGIAVDGQGNVYVVATTPQNVPLSTVTSQSTLGARSNSTVVSNGGLSVPSFPPGSVSEILAFNGSIPTSPISRTLIPLSYPTGVAVDGHGNVYVANGCGQAVVFPSPCGSVIELAAVNGSVPTSPVITTLGSGFSFPTGVAVDVNGDVFVSNDGNGTIQELVEVNGGIPASPTINTLGSGFSYPTGLALDVHGNVYVADTENNRVEMLSSSSGGLVGAVSGVNFGSVNVGATSPSVPLTFTIDTSGTLGSMSVLTQGVAGLEFVNTGTGTCAANTAYTAGQTCTVNVIFTPRFAGTRYGAVVFNDPIGNPIATAYTQGTGVGPQINFMPGVQSVLGSGFDSPMGVAVDGIGNIYLADTFHGQVKELLVASGSVPSYPAIRILWGGFNTPVGVAVDGSGNVYVADSGNNAVYELQAVNGSVPSSPLLTKLGSGFSGPMGVAVDGSGNVYVADTGNNAIKEIVAVNGSISESPTINVVGNGFMQPRSVAVDGNGNVYACETINSVQEIVAVNGSIPASPTILTLASGFGQDLAGVAVDGRGNLFVTDWYRNEVFELQAVNGSMPSSPSVRAVASGLSTPYGVAVDSAGNLYVPNWGNSELVKVDFADAPSLRFASTAVNSTSSDSPQTVVVENVGNAALSFPFSSTGSNPSIAENFAMNSNEASACSVVGSGSSSLGSLAAGESCELSIGFAPTVAGALSGSLMLTDNNLNAAAPPFATQSIALTGKGTQGAPTITWASPASITYGTALSATQLNATSTVAGTFTYSPAAGTVPTAGQQTLTATFTPTDQTDYTTSTATVTLTVTQASATIGWASPASIVYGTAVSATQLNATSPVAGTFTYSPAAGTMPTVGQQTLTATFTPTDQTDYTTSTTTVTLAVTQATATIAWASPASIIYGTAVSATQLNATSPVAGTFAYSPAAGTIPTVGQQALTVIFTPTDTTDYTTSTATVTLTVTQATATITWASPAPIIYGTALSATQLNATSPVAGTFTYSLPAGTVPTAGPQKLTVTFAPTDSTDYATSTAAVTLTVTQAKPTITWASPAAITYGKALSATQLNATSPVAGTFTYSPAAETVPTAGPQTLTATFTPTDTTNYTTSTAAVTLTVIQAEPAITWASPAAITYGTALSGTQLNASSTVAGTFTYSPAAGAVLNVGTETLTVTFTPTDATDYTAATTTVKLIVNKATYTVAWASPSAISYGTPLSGIQLDATSTAAGSFKYSSPAGTVLGVGTHTLTATFTPDIAGNYTTGTAMATVKLM